MEQEGYPTIKQSRHVRNSLQATPENKNSTFQRGAVIMARTFCCIEQKKASKAYRYWLISGEACKVKVVHGIELPLLLCYTGLRHCRRVTGHYPDNRDWNICPYRCQAKLR